MRDITIKPALNGYLVRVGCQRIVFTSREIMLRALNDYLTDPETIESDYLLKSMNSKQLGFTPDRIEPGTLHRADSAPSIYPSEPPVTSSSSHED